MPGIEAAHGVAEDADLPRNITLFGGEPLLAENRSTIEYILERAFASGKANFSAITNGTELEAYQDLLAPDKISWLQITLDGIPQEHDKRRIYADGKGSYEKIAQNITRALDLGVRVAVRMNIDRNNVNKLPDLADEIVAR
ncbi:MAG: radical SAM protein, partial [Microcystis panniformis]